MQLNGFSAWISMEDEEATTEYAVETDDVRGIVTCWIASEVGKTFCVRWRNESYKAEDLSARVAIDGNPCGRLLQPLTRQRPNYMDGVNEGGILRRFTFASLMTTDDDESLTTALTEDFGVIELSLVPIEIQRQIEKPTVVDYALPDVVVHERSKKAVTQRVSLGEPTNVKALPKFRTYDLGPPIGTFRFKYRPLDILRANGIAPQPPNLKRKASSDFADSPSRPPAKRKASASIQTSSAPRSTTPIIIDVDDEESDAEDDTLKLLQQQMDALQAQKSSLEARKAARKNTGTKVKEEETALKVKSEDVGPKDNKPAFIDLTSD